MTISFIIGAVKMQKAKQNGWYSEFLATIKLAWPLIIAQLASISLFTTDVIMMGWLGPKYLAAGTLATSILHPLFIGSIGIVSATSPLIAQAIGAKKIREVRKIVRQGFWVAFMLTLIITPILYNAKSIFLFLRQDIIISEMAQIYLYFAAGVVLPGLMFISLRSLLYARDGAIIVLFITIVGIFVNALGNYALMFGNFGFPRLELIGAGISTSLVNLVMFLLILAYILLSKRFRRFNILFRFFKPDWQRFFQLLKIGIPIGLTIMSEILMFSVAVIMMGWLGMREVAAHAIALQCAAIAFMIPLGLSQATTVRVGLFAGEQNKLGVSRAGWTSFYISVFFMTISSALFIFTPDILVHLFLDPNKEENIPVILLAISFLSVAAIFQFVDGAQVVMAAALRGLNDTFVPMILAFIGYWIVGMGTAYYAAFIADMGGVGVWLGMAAGLAFVAIALSFRFIMRKKLRLMEKVAIREQGSAQIDK